MHVLFYSFHAVGGGFSNLRLLLRACVARYPEDQFTIVSTDREFCLDLSTFSNARIVNIGNEVRRESRRLRLGCGGLKSLAGASGANVVWGINFGSYVRMDIPQVLSINNAHQVYPREVMRLHPDNRWRVAVLRYFARLSIRASSAVVVQTDLMKHYVGRVKGVPAQIFVVPKAVETCAEVAAEQMPNEIQRALAASAGEPKPFTFLYVAGCYPHKNHKVLVGAAQRIEQGGLNGRIVVTTSLAEMRAAVGNDRVDPAVWGKIVPVGWVRKAHLRALYNACDACLIPSLLESLSSTHLEAMAWDKPMISADRPYARDLCLDASLYVDPKNADAWYAAMKSLMTDAALRARLVRAGRTRLSCFPESWDEVAWRVREILHAVARGELANRRR